MTPRRSVAQTPGQSDLHVLAVISANLPSTFSKMREPLASLLSWTCQLRVEAGRRPPPSHLPEGGVSVSGAPLFVLHPLRTPGPKALSSLSLEPPGRLARGLCPPNATFFGIKEHILDSLLAKCDKLEDLGSLGLGPHNVPTGR